jgi:hypothetical protein
LEPAGLRPLKHSTLKETDERSFHWTANLVDVANEPGGFEEVVVALDDGHAILKTIKLFSTIFQLKKTFYSQYFEWGCVIDKVKEYF